MSDRKDFELRIKANNAASKDLKKVVDDLAALEKAQAGQTKAADKGEITIAQLAATMARLQKIAKDLAAQQALTKTFEAQNKELAEAKARTDAARQAQETYNKSLTGATAVTKAQEREQAKLTAAVVSAERAHLRVQTRLEKTTATLRASGIETDKLADAQRRISEAITRGNAAIERQDDVLRRAETSTRRFTASGDASARTMQRIRASVMGAAGAYLSLHGAIRTAGGAIEAQSTREAIRSQLGIANANDAKAVGDDFAYIAAQAERLGIEFAVAARGYAKFSAASRMAGRTQQETRYIWETFAEVARVANLSSQDLDGVFKALEQIQSKGKIMAEELRLQLGDRLVGAFQVAAKALADEFPNLSKAMEQGEVSAEELIRIAEKYREIVADQLPAATRNLRANQARLNSSVEEFQALIAESGVADAYSNLLKELTAFLRSSEGHDAAQSIAAGFKAVGEAILFTLRHLPELKALLSTIATIWAGIKLTHLTVQIVEWGKALRGVTGTLSGASKAVAVFSAAVIGWDIGRYLNDKFVEVRRFGIALVTGLAISWEHIKAGAAIAWEEIPRYARNAMASVLNAVTYGMRLVLRAFARGARAIGADTLADSYARAIEGMTATHQEQGDRIAEIRAQLARDVAAIRDIGDEMWRDAQRTQSTDAPAAIGTTGSPGRRTRGAGEMDEKALARRQTLIEQITRALEVLESKIDRAESDSLAAQLRAIDTTYADLSRKIAALGGATGEAFMRQLNDSIGRLRQQTVDKFNADLLKRQEALQAQLERLDAAAGRRAKSDLDARLAAVRAQYEGTYRDIAALRDRLERNQLSTAPADAARQRLDAGIAELQALETQRFHRDELRRLEGEINDLLATRSDRLKTIRDQESAGIISAAKARTQTEDTIRALQPQIAGLADVAIAFADSLRGAFDPVALDAFIAKLDLARVSGQALGRSFELTGRQVEEMIAQRSVAALDAMGEAIGGAIAGTQSWRQAIGETGRAFLRFAAEFLREIATMIIRAQILKALQSWGGGDGIAGLINASVRHRGGLAGAAGGPSRLVPAGLFANVPRYHTGGFAGLAPGEVPAILQRTEEVLTRDDPRHILNGGGKSGGGGQRFVLVDDRSKVAEAMAGAEGEQVTMVHLRRNIPTLKQMLK